MILKSLLNWKGWLNCKYQNTVIKKKYYTTAALKDELTRTLSSAAEYNINLQSNHIEIDYKYYRYAQKLLYLTSISIGRFLYLKLDNLIFQWNSRMN